MKKIEVRLKVGFDGREGLRLETEDGMASIGCTWGRDKHLCAERLVACWNALAGIQNPSAIPDVVEALKRLAREVKGCWGMDEPTLRQELGNTNYNAVDEKLTVARSALAKLEGGGM